MGVPPDVAYVACCALGLAFSDGSRDQGIDDLRRAANGKVGVLKRAQEVLPASPIEDTTVVGAASTLLAAAIKLVEGQADPWP